MTKALKVSMFLMLLALTAGVLTLKYSAPRSMSDLRHDHADAWYAEYSRCATEAGKGSPMLFKTAIKECQLQTDKTVLGGQH